MKTKILILLILLCGAGAFCLPNAGLKEEDGRPHGILTTTILAFAENREDALNRAKTIGPRQSRPVLLELIQN